MLSALVLIILGIRGFSAPTQADARARLDETLPGRPLATLEDEIATGSSDPGTAAVWTAHRDRMAARLASARAVPGDLRVARRDPFALRYMAVLLAAVALLFGTLWRVPDAPTLPGVGTQVATGPAWEGWLVPPRHTGLPTLYLNDIDSGAVEIPEGTRVTLRLYGEVGTLSVSETVSGRNTVDPSESLQEFDVVQSGTLAIHGDEDLPVWTLTAAPDGAPTIAFDGVATYEHPDQVVLPWSAQDDIAVVAGEITIDLDVDGTDRRYGLAVEPEPREGITLDLALPITGERNDFSEVFRANLTEHPLAGMPVTVTLTARDASDQAGQSTSR